MRRLRPGIALVAVAAALPLPPVAAAAPDAPPAAPPVWVREGFAEARDLAAADFDADGSAELVYGGRGVAVLDADAPRTHRPRLTVRPLAEEVDNVLDGGDNQWTTGVEVVSATGDATPDLLYTTSDTDAYLVDGATGRHVWHNPRTGSGLSFGFGLLDAPGDAVPDLFPTGGKDAIDGATGSVAWTAAIAKPARHVVTAELDGRPGRDVLVSHDPVGPSNLTGPSVYALSGSGQVLWSFGAVTVVHDLAAGDLDGDGRDEAIIANHQGAVVAVGAAGLRWATPIGASPVSAVAAGDTDGDGLDEVFGAAVTDAVDFAVVGLTPTGVPLWRHPVPRPANVLEPAPGVLIVGTGEGDRDTGVAMALATSPTAVQRERWRVAAQGQVASATVARHQGRDVVAFGGDEAVLRVVDLATGAPIWKWTSGDFLRAADAGDTDGDGVDEVATADDRGHVMLVEADGAVRWTATPQAGRSTATGVAILRGSGPKVAGIAHTYSPGDGSSTLAAWHADGRPAWSIVVPGSSEALAPAELTGDDVDDLVVGEYPSLHADGDGCFVSAYNGRSGVRLWRTQISGGCLVSHIGVDRDSGPIAYGDQALFEVPHVALLGRDGSLRWNLAVDESTGWVAPVPGGVVAGGYASEARGHVTLRHAADGGRGWRRYFGSGRASNGLVESGGASRYGRAIDDLDGDGAPEILTSSDEGTFSLLDGRTGARRWSTQVESWTTTPITQIHASGPAAVVPRPDGPPVVVAAQFATGQPVRGSGYVLDLAGGLLSTFPLMREARDIVAFDAGGRHLAAVAAGLSLTAIAPYS